MYEKITLKNGLRVVTSSMPHMESVSIGLWIGVGARYETKKLSGVSHLIEHMLFKGTLSRTANELKEAIEGVGGTFNAFTGEEETCFLVKLPSKYLELGLNILSDMVLNPKLDNNELEKEKYVICEEIKMYMDHPGHHVFDILSQTMWPNEALGRPIAGYIESVKSFKREDLTRFMKQYYQPANTVIVAAGRFDTKKCLSFAKNTFSMDSAKRFPCELVGKVEKTKQFEFFHKKTQQSHIAFGFYGFKRSDKRVYALALLHIILGGNMSSRLFDRLREEKALCYEISSGVKKYRETGAFIIHAGIANDKITVATKEVLSELREIKKNLVTSDEICRAKEYATGQLLLALEDTAARMIWLGEKIMLDEGVTSTKELLKLLKKVTKEEIRSAANIIFTDKNLNFATIGPVTEQIKNNLKKALVI
ncbi:MAG: pitrilysin family protein [Candidatus Omnitrophota bacterium]